MRNMNFFEVLQTMQINYLDAYGGYGLRHNGVQKSSGKSLQAQSNVKPHVPDPAPPLAPPAPEQPVHQQLPQYEPQEVLYSVEELAPEGQPGGTSGQDGHRNQISALFKFLKGVMLTAIETGILQN